MFRPCFPTKVLREHGRKGTVLTFRHGVLRKRHRKSFCNLVDLLLLGLNFLVHELFVHIIPRGNKVMKGVYVACSERTAEVLTIDGQTGRVVWQGFLRSEEHTSELQTLM